MSLRIKLLEKVAGFLGVKSFVNPTMDELGLQDTNRLPKPSTRPYGKYLEAYADSNWVYACVNRIAQDVAAAPIALFNGDGEVVEKHPALDILEYVNGQMTRYDLFEWTQASLELTGNTYWKLDDLTSRGQPKSLWPMIASMVEIKPSNDPKVFKEGYIYHANGRQIPYKAEEIIQFKFFNPLDYFYGLAPLAAARLGVDINRASSNWNLKFFDNSARADIIFSTPHSLTPDQRKRMSESWKQMHGGEDKAHGVAFLEKGTKSEIVGVNAKDMDFVLQKKMTREEICAVFGVPPVLVGLFEYANYANATEQEQIYWRNTIIPKLTKLTNMLNEFYLPLFDATGKYYFGIIESSIKALRADEDKRSVYVLRYWGMGVPFNSLIKSFDLPFAEISGGDVSYIPLGVIQAGQVEEEEPGKVNVEKLRIKILEEDKARTRPTQGQLRAKHHRFMLLAGNLSKPFQKAMQGYFNGQKKTLVEAIRKYEGRKPDLNALGFNVQMANAKLRNLMTPMLYKSVFAGRDSENLMLATLIERRIPKPSQKAEDRIRQWVELKAFKWAEEINQTTLKKLNKEIEESVAEGEGMSELSERVSKVFNIERDYRTLRIAQTEVIASLNDGSLEAYRDNEMVAGKGWLAAYDEATRESHIMAGAKYGMRGGIPVDEDFVFEWSGASGPAPGDMGLAAENCNCRCAIWPIIKAA